MLPKLQAAKYRSGYRIALKIVERVEGERTGTRTGTPLIPTISPTQLVVNRAGSLALAHSPDGGELHPSMALLYVRGTHTHLGPMALRTWGGVVVDGRVCVRISAYFSDSLAASVVLHQCLAANAGP